MIYAIMGDGRVRHLPRGVDQYLDELAAGIPRRAPSNALTPAAEMSTGLSTEENSQGVEPLMADAAAARAAKKELNRIERQLAKLTETETKLHDQLAASASDYERLAELDTELRKLADERGELETAWFEAAERAE
jgi:ATP-binding cassette subfamily F protein uup